MVVLAEGPVEVPPVLEPAYFGELLVDDAGALLVELVGAVEDEHLEVLEVVDDLDEVLLLPQLEPVNLQLLQPRQRQDLPHLRLHALAACHHHPPHLRPALHAHLIDPVLAL